MAILRRDVAPSPQVSVLVVGAGACGLTAALAAGDAGAEVLVLERDPVPTGSTALSSGFIPACRTRWQRAAGVEDDVETMLGDIQRKNHGEGDVALARTVCAVSGATLEWLADQHGQEFVLLDGFLYPGHSVLRMHAHPERTGAALVGALAAAVERAGIDVVCEAVVRDLIADSHDRVLGVVVERPDGTTEEIGCRALVLACNGFGGNPEMVRQHIPEMADALYFGHTGNRGDAVNWGRDLGAGLAQMGSYQGHGSVAHPHGALMTWALMMDGGIQVNVDGVRFSNEHEGYSEQSVKVLAQPGGTAWNIYDRRLHEMGLGFEDYRGATDTGAVREAADLGALATIIGCDPDSLGNTLADVAAYAAGTRTDPFGRDFTAGAALAEAPYFTVRVTGALFHTQGGLEVDARARVLKADGTPFANLFAGGGAAVGLSGSGVAGYLSGNGLLTAMTLGRLAGIGAATIDGGAPTA